MEGKAMSKFVGQKEARAAAESGLLIGQTEPTRETKWSWWKVYVTPSGDIIACVMADAVGVVCGEKLDKSEVGRYVDDTQAALLALSNAPASSYWWPDGRCIHCGAGNDAHHSYTCPTNMTPDKT